VAENLEPGTKNLPCSYRNLVLWQKAQELTLEVIRIASRLPKDPAAAVIARQIVASSSSIGASVAEGHGRFSPAAHRNHLSIAKGSACETDGWLDLLHRAGYIDAGAEGRLHASCDELIRMLTAKIRQLERLGQSKIKEEMALYTTEDYASDQQVPGSRF
jgi:four helix bundle protein